jgi:hypothetical protein
MEVYRSFILYRNALHLHLMYLFVEFKVHAELVVDEVVLQQIFLRIFLGFPC